MMRLLLHLLALVSLCTVVAGDGASVRARLQRSKERRQEQYLKYIRRNDQASTLPKDEKRATSPFLNSKSQKFLVNGTALPDVPFDVGESYAGLLPISSAANESRQLYFWFFPTPNDAVTNEITIWLQGGPGGSSLFGLLYENGPFLWQPGTGTQPTKNTYAWNNITNMVWVDCPVGVGFSQGKPNITNEYELAKQFMGFFKNFVQTFNMQGYKVYLTGESYAGYYIPYIGNAFLEANDTQNFNLKGALITDPIIGDEVIHFEGVAMQYLNTWSQVFGLNSSVTSTISAANQKCGYPAYLDKYFKFPPPPGPFPGIFGKDYGSSLPDNCDIQGDIITAVTALNPCFNEDHILDTCPVMYSPLGVYNVNYDPAGPPIYFDRADVQRAIHAPVGTNWSISAAQNVFVGPNVPYSSHTGDASLPPAQIGLVSNLIEKTNNVIIGVGGLDFQLPANGTLLVLQNMTWNGAQGFHTYPSNTLYVPQHADTNPGSMSGSGAMGTWVTERGLTFFVSHFAGHEEPWYAPGASYRALQALLGRIPNLSATGNF